MSRGGPRRKPSADVAWKPPAPTPMDIHPAVAFGSVIAGAALFGPIGALIGIPVAAAIIAFAQAYTRRYEVIPQLQGEEDDSEPQPA